MEISNQSRIELRKLLQPTTETKKHSSYQILPKRLEDLIGDASPSGKSKYESERLHYILSKINIVGKSVLDVGCNTGYFTFELIDAGAKNVVAYEGGTSHFAFMSAAVNALDEIQRIVVRHKYFLFSEEIEKLEVALLLNVVHHTGDDYGDRLHDMEGAKAAMLKNLNDMTRYADTLVFQMGFNWKGDIKKCLFDRGTKAEMIEFIKNGTAGYWRIDDIGIAGREGTKVRYANVDERNIARDDSLGEFLNRPIFILRAER